jgi:hypothetical protein
VRVASDAGLRQAARDNLEALAHRHTWSEAVRPLVAWLERPERAAAAMDLDNFVRDERRDPAPGSITALFPLPLRRHVLGPAKRGLKRAVIRIADR